MKNLKIALFFILAFLATISSVAYFVFSAGDDKWIECKTDYDDTKDPGANQYCCRDGTNNNWFVDDSKCLPTVTKITHHIQDGTTDGGNPQVGQKVTITAEFSDDETGIKEIKILIDENGDDNFNDATKTCTSSPCTFGPKTYNTPGQVVRYYAYAIDNAKKMDSPYSPKPLAVACDNGCSKDTSDNIQSFTVVTSPIVCTPANPTVTIKESTQSATAGTELEYNVEVKNNDNNCLKGALTLTASCPASPSGWACLFDTTPKTLEIDSGKSQVTKLKIKSPTGVSVGDYQFKVKATKGSYSDEGQAVYRVIAQPILIATVSPNPLADPVFADGVSLYTITASTPDNQNNKKITFTSSSSVNIFNPSTAECTTDVTGKCSVKVASSTYGTPTITASSDGYASGTVSIKFIPKVKSITYEPITSTKNGDTITLKCELETTTIGISNVKVWAGECAANDCYNTRAWSTATSDKVYFNGDSMVQPASGNVYTKQLTINQPVSSGIGATCQAEASGLQSNWGNNYNPMLTVTSSPTPPAANGNVFVTSVNYDGNLGGIDGADTKCQSLATSAGLVGTWKAWLSKWDVNAKDRIIDKPYYTMNGDLVAASKADLIDGTIANPINRDEKNNLIERSVWTGTKSDGTKVDLQNCNSWRTDPNLQSGAIGASWLTDSSWTLSSSGVVCNTLRRLYCFEQTPPSSSSQPIPQLGILVGKVKDSSTGAGISGATVTLSTATQPTFKQTTTDTNGNYETKDVTAGTYTATASKSGYDSQSSSVSITTGQTTTKDFSLTPTPPPCTYSLSMVNLQKTNTFQNKEKSWDVAIHDSSTQTCGATIGYTASNVIIGQKCHSSTGLYKFGSRIISANRINLLPSGIPLSVGKNGDLNAFTVYVKTTGSNSCTVSFEFRAPNGNIVDPSFTATPPNTPNQAPYVSIFDFSGDTSLFTVKWETLYPDNNPERNMKIKCGLNCNPELQDCSAVAGKGCLPYDASQGTDEIKKGGCDVPSPAYDFTLTNKIICFFYDPADVTLNKTINHDFTPVDFEARTSSKITATVGQTAELKIDITNKGLLPDRYEITIAPPSIVDVSPTAITTDIIQAKEVVSAFTSATPLVDEESEITIDIKSVTSGKISTLKITVSPRFFALPEFGLTGFLQIVIIATIIYFLLFNRMTDSHRRRKRR